MIPGEITGRLEPRRPGIGSPVDGMTRGIRHSANLFLNRGTVESLLKKKELTSNIQSAEGGLNGERSRTRNSNSKFTIGFLKTNEIAERSDIIIRCLTLDVQCSTLIFSCNSVWHKCNRRMFTKNQSTYGTMVPDSTSGQQQFAPLQEGVFIPLIHVWII